jgi:hypothetical protein
MKPLKTGILIAGSLYWRREAHRQAWREQFLNMTVVHPVTAPLRYGRLSRSGSYTMVFAPGTPNGQAKVVACQREAGSLGDIVKEAEALWRAERRPSLEPLAGQRHSGDWGCVALLPNPIASVAASLLDEWAGCVAQECRDRGHTKNYDARAYNVRGRSAINDRGILQIPWPDQSNTGGPLDGLDLLLATATMPNSDTGDFPSVAAIAAAWNTTKDAGYFHGNRKHGFYSFQDDEIAALLSDETRTDHNIGCVSAAERET